MTPEELEKKITNEAFNATLYPQSYMMGAREYGAKWLQALAELEALRSTDGHAIRKHFDHQIHLLSQSIADRDAIIRYLEDKLRTYENKSDGSN